MFVLMLIAATTESNPISAIRPIGVIAGTGAGVGRGGGAAFCKVSSAHSVHRMSSAVTHAPGPMQ